MLQYPKVLDMLNEDGKLIILAEAFGIPYEIKTITGGDSEWGRVGTYYDVDYTDFGMPDEELEEFVATGLRAARTDVANALIAFDERYAISKLGHSVREEGRQ